MSINKDIGPEIAARLTDALENVEKHLKQVENIVVVGVKCCPNCENFNAEEQCKLATPPQRPPAKVIAFGCSAFDSRIPF